MKRACCGVGRVIPRTKPFAASTIVARNLHFEVINKFTLDEIESLSCCRPKISKPRFPELEIDPWKDRECARHARIEISKESNSVELYICGVFGLMHRHITYHSL